MPPTIEGVSVQCENSYRAGLMYVRGGRVQFCGRKVFLLRIFIKEIRSVHGEGFILTYLIHSKLTLMVNYSRMIQTFNGMSECGWDKSHVDIGYEKKMIAT